MTEISVVIPTYNPGQLLLRALSSVLSQTWMDLEVIVVDDGSSEDLGWVEDSDPRVRFYRQANSGVSATRNRGVRLSASPWVAFIDQDDEWLPNKVEAQFEAVSRSPQSSFCSTSFVWVKENGDELKDGRPMTYERLASDGTVCLSTAMVSRDRYLEVGGQNPLLHQVGDFDLFLKLARRGPIVHVDEPLVRYYYHGENASRDYRSAYRERQTVLVLHEIDCLRVGYSAGAAACRAGRRHSRVLFGAQAYDAARASVSSADMSAAIGHLARAGRWSPGYVGRSLIKTRFYSHRRRPATLT